MTAMVRFKPFNGPTVADLVRDFEREFGRGAQEATRWQPAADIREGQEAWYVDIDAPGIDREAFAIEVEDGVLSVQAERKAPQAKEGERFHRHERRYGAFTRTFRLPDTVDGNGIEAAYTNGVLTLTLPKRPETQPKRIDVKVN